MFHSAAEVLSATAKGVYHWHKYCVDNGKHLFHGDATAMKCIMLTSRFGVTTEYLEQLHERMLREHVSFVGEADVAARLAKRRGLQRLLPKRLRLYLAQAWYFWRLALRSQTLPSESNPVIDLRGGVEAIIEELWPRLEK